MIKLAMGMMVCGSLVACGGAVQAPVAALEPVQTCAGGVAKDDAELAAFRRCALISGDLAVIGSTNLAALSNLRVVSGTLSLTHTAVEELSALGSLSSVGRLEIRNNSHLFSLQGLSRLQTAREVALEGNPDLRGLDGLSGLRQLERLSIRQTSLYSLHRVENLSKVNEIELVDNRKLIDPRALNQVREAREVVIRHNPRLCAHFGLLAGLQHAERLSLSQNIALDALSGAALRQK